MKEILDKLDEGVKSLFDSDKYAEYLSVMSRFHNYSTRNTLLIFAQNPNAHRVAGYTSWLKNFNRQVKGGERGIKILAPIAFKDVRESVKLDPISNQPILDEYGNTVMEAKERIGARFRTVSVFDISQTTGEPLPELAEPLTGDVKLYELFMDALRAVSPLPIGFEQMPSDIDGICYMGDRIAIREGMSEVQTVAAVIHEMAHAKLHDGVSLDAEGNPKSKRVEEVEAESVSYVVCQKFGVETGANAFGYVGSWSKNEETKELQTSLDTIRKASAELIDNIEEKYCELAKERGIDLFTGTEYVEQKVQAPEYDITNDREAMIQRILNDLTSHDPDFPKRALEYIEKNMRQKSMEDLREDYYFYFPKKPPVLEQEAEETIESTPEVVPETTAVEAVTQSQSSEQAEPQYDKPVERPITALQQKALDYAKSLASLPLQSRLNIIAKAFNCKTATIERRLCTGKWRGYTDVSIRFDNGASLAIGTRRTPETKKKSVIDEFVNDTLAYYNPTIIAESKALAAAALLKREAEDNAIAKEHGLQPYKFLNVEINDGSVNTSGGYIGWYSVTLEVNGKIINHVETGLNYDIAGGKVSESIEKPKYYVAGGLKDEDADFVFNGVGFCSTKNIYTLTTSEEVINRAMETLAKRNGKEEIHEMPSQPTSLTPDDKEFWRSEIAAFLSANDGKMKLIDLDSSPYSNHGGLEKFAQTFSENGHKCEFANIVAQENTKRTGEPWISFNFCEGGAYRPDFLQTPTAMLFAEADKFIKDYEPKIREMHDGGYDKLDFTMYYKRDDNEVCSSNDRYDIGDSKKVSGFYNVLKAETDYYYSHPEIYNSFNPNRDITADKERAYADIEILKRAITTEYPYVEIEKVIRYAEGDRLDEKVFNKGEILTFAEADSKIKSEEKAMREQYVKKYGSPGDGDEELGIAVHFKLPGETEPNVFRLSYLLGDYDEERGGLLKHFEMGTTYYNACIKNGDYGNVNAMLGGKTTDDAIRLASEYTKTYEVLRDSMIEPVEKSAVEQTTAVAPTLPDPTVSITDMTEYGYTADELLPLSQTRALELFDADNTVYLLYPDNTEAMAFDREEISQHDGLFGIEKADWEKLLAADERQCEYKLETDFFNTNHTNMFAIYQVRDDIENAHNIRFAYLKELEEQGIVPTRSDYKLVYAAPFSERIEYLLDRHSVLNKLFEKFNIDRPEDFTGRSMSMSDVVVLRYNGDMSAHYVDRTGFTELDRVDFYGEPLDNGNHVVKNESDQTFYQVENRSDNTPTVAELEADVKAGKPISLMDLAEAIHAEQKRPPMQKGKPDFLAKIEANKQRVAQASGSVQKTNQREVE